MRPPGVVDRTTKAATMKNAAVSLVIAAAVLSPWFGIPSWNASIAVTALIFGIAASAVNLMLGYGGLLTLGAAFFMGMGGYGEALAYMHLNWPLLPAAVASIVFSMGAAALLGILLVRLPRFYFAVATLGLSVALSGVLAALPNFTGGSSGITHARQLSFGFFNISSITSWYLLSLTLAALVVALIKWITRGKARRLLALAREDELAANVLGVEVFRVRLILFVLAAGILALSGTVLFPWEGVIVPDSAGLVQSVLLLGSAVVGGMGIPMGGFVGAGLLTWAQSLVSGFGNYESLIYGVAFLAVVFYLPLGIGGSFQALWRIFDRYSSTARADSPKVPSEMQVRQAALPAEPASAAPAVHYQHNNRHSEPAPSFSRGATADEQGLKLDRATKHFGGVIAVESVSMTIPAGSIVGVIGANGAGKSTLLNLISGVELLDSGTLMLNGSDISNDTAAQRAAKGLARTFQTPRLVEQMSVLENVMLGIEALEGGALRCSSDREERARSIALEVLDRAGLNSLASRDVRSLGSGERKFIELLRAFACNPSVLLMDEPGTGLSRAELQSLTSQVRALASLGTGILLVDHNMDFVGDLVSWVYVMEMGSVAMQGSPHELEMVRAGKPSREAEMFRDGR